VLNAGRLERKLVTGLLFVDPSKAPLGEELGLVETPLARLGLDDVRPPAAVLDEIMESYRRGSAAAAAGGG